MAPIKMIGRRDARRQNFLEADTETFHSDQRNTIGPGCKEQHPDRCVVRLSNSSHAPLCRRWNTDFLYHTRHGEHDKEPDSQRRDDY